MKSQHWHTFQPLIPPSNPHSRISPYIIQCLQLPLLFSLCPNPHPALVHPPQPIRTHSVVVLILPPSLHSPPMSLLELPPHQWLIQSPLWKSPHWTTLPHLLHHQKYLQASQFCTVPQLTPTLHDQSTLLLAVLLFAMKSQSGLQSQVPLIEYNGIQQWVQAMHLFQLPSEGFHLGAQLAHQWMGFS